jgi:holo-[acyl-carrier protein] synthase
MVQHVGGLFAAKEAVLKALGTGWGSGAWFRDVEVVREPGLGPTIRLHDGALRRARELGVERIHVSITHERAHAAAIAVLEG